MITMNGQITIHTITFAILMGFIPMHIDKTLLPVLMISAALLGSTSSFAKQYYKWVDRNGSTHYTTTPPPKSAIKKGKVETYGWKSAGSTAPATATTAAQNPAEKNPAVATTTPNDKAQPAQGTNTTSQTTPAVNQPPAQTPTTQTL